MKMIFVIRTNSASTLKTVWERTSGYAGSSDEEGDVSPALSRIDQLIDKIATWNSTPIPSGKCSDYLQEILKTVQEVEEVAGSSKYWAYKLCNENQVSSFLINIVQVKTASDPGDLAMIQFLLRKLVAPAKQTDFPGRDTLIKWVHVGSNSVDLPSILANACVKSLPDLIKVLKETFVPSLQKSMPRM